MTKKQRLAKFIINNPRAGKDEWAQFIMREPWVRIRTVGKGQVQINLEGASGYIDPISWLANHRAGLIQDLRQCLSNSEGILTIEELVDCGIKCDKVEDESSETMRRILHELVERGNEFYNVTWDFHLKGSKGFKISSVLRWIIYLYTGSFDEELSEEELFAKLSDVLSYLKAV